MLADEAEEAIEEGGVTKLLAPGSDSSETSMSSSLSSEIEIVGVSSVSETDAF